MDDEEALMKKITASTLLRACLFFFALTLPLSLSGCGGGGGNLPTYNVAGSWFLYYVTPSTPGAQGPDLFTFTTSQNTLGGTTAQGQAVSGSVSGTSISFSYVDLLGNTDSYLGTVNSNATMSGTWVSTNGQSGTWDALYDNTTIGNVSIEGTWSITIASASTNETGTFVLTQPGAGNPVSGTTTLSSETVTGTVSNSTILFSWEDSNGVTTNVCVGTIGAGATSMAGTWTNTNGQSGTWTGTLQPS